MKLFAVTVDEQDLGYTISINGQFISNHSNKKTACKIARRLAYATKLKKPEPIKDLTKGTEFYLVHPTTNTILKLTWIGDAFADTLADSSNYYATKDEAKLAAIINIINKD